MTINDYLKDYLSKMLDDWIACKGYTVNTQAVFIACLHQYCRYINFLVIKAYIPDAGMMKCRATFC